MKDRNVHTQCKEHVRHRDQDQCVDCGKRQMREEKQDEQDDKQKRRAYFAEPHGAVQHFTSFQKIKSHDPHVSLFDCHQS